jgi:hypothetical protein
MDRDPIKTAIRETRRENRLGQLRVCFLCGYADPVAFVVVTPEWSIEKGVPRSFFEKHHPNGEEHDREFKMPICRNCHARATEGLLRAGVTMETGT